MAIVRGAHRVGQRKCQRQEFFERKTARRDDLDERLALDELHRQEMRFTGLFDRMDRDNVWMIEGRDRLRFALESVESL